MIERLFDIVAQRVTKSPEATMLAAKENGVWKTYSASEVWSLSNELAAGISSLGLLSDPSDIDKQAKIALISPNRPEWIITDVASQLTGGVLTPVYPTISPNELVYIFNESEIKIVFVANKDIYERFEEAFKSIPSLQYVYSFDELQGVRNWKSLLQKGVSINSQTLDSITTNTLATIIYTSGTTGNPKGVMLTHKNIASNVNDCLPVFSFAEEGRPALSFLPMNHIFERTVTYIYLIAGVPIYYAESMDTIGLNLKEVKPHVFTTVPRLLEKVYERILNTGLELKGIKRALFFWALELGKKYDNHISGSAWYRFQLAIANALVFKKWREALGGNVKSIVVGSAATQERLVRIFSAAQLTIEEGYGLTETSPVISVNRFESVDRRIGTVGPIIQNVQVQLAEDGEILVKGNNVTIGYYKQPELTKGLIDEEGWLHTGDIGEMVDGRFLKITDRKKEMFKTSGGKYVAPQVVENKMKESIFIEQMMVIGNGRKFVSALIVPSFVQVRKYLREHNAQLSIPESNSELIKLKEVQALIQKQIDKYNPGFSHPEQVKKFALLPDEWTIDSGELTPSLKIKRKVIEQKYTTYIDAIYESEPY